MPVFTDAEVAYLHRQRIGRLATSSASGMPDVAAVTYSLEGDSIVSGGYDITKTVRFRNLLANPRAVIVVDDLAATDPWTPRGVKIRGAATLEEVARVLHIRIVPEVVWSWGINLDAQKRFMSVERRDVSST
jgi:pyridoxamine 5'-phosphate oxidase family protein